MSFVIVHASVDAVLAFATAELGESTVTQKLTQNYFTPKLSQLNPKMYPRGHTEGSSCT
jgi:membrane carboxypeptidase/penicillin-binding protein